MKYPLIRKINIPFKPPKTIHRRYENGVKIFDNQWGKDRKLFIPVKLEVKSEHWWPAQSVTTLKSTKAITVDMQGKYSVVDVPEVIITDVFEYGEYYVISMNDKYIQVIHDGHDKWHIPEVK